MDQNNSGHSLSAHFEVPNSLEFIDRDNNYEFEYLFEANPRNKYQLRMEIGTDDQRVPEQEFQENFKTLRNKLMLSSKASHELMTTRTELNFGHLLPEFRTNNSKIFFPFYGIANLYSGVRSTLSDPMETFQSITHYFSTNKVTNGTTSTIKIDYKSNNKWDKKF